MLTCAARENPWECVYSRSGRILDSLDAVVQRKEQELKGTCELNKHIGLPSKISKLKITRKFYRKTKQTENKNVQRINDATFR